MPRMDTNGSVVEFVHDTFKNASIGPVSIPVWSLSKVKVAFPVACVVHGYAYDAVAETSIPFML